MALTITDRTWVLVDDTGRPMTLNKVATLHRQTWATHTRIARRRWWALALAAKVPHLDAITVDVTPLHANRRSPQDVAACAPEIKAAIDGLVDARVIPDDTAIHLHAVTFRPPDICGIDGVRLTITEEP
jgi:hypothetical protein